MPSPDEIVLYHSPASRAFTAYWMLAELDVPFRVETVDIREGAQKSAEYLKINPLGKVPAVKDGAAVIWERPAICIHLADKYAYGRLAPRIEAPERADYLKWMVFSVSVLEPAVMLRQLQIETPAYQAGWGDFDTAVEVLLGAFEDRQWLIGADFGAADVMLGGNVSWMLFNKLIPAHETFTSYNERIAARPGYQRAVEATWGDM